MNACLPAMNEPIETVGRLGFENSAVVEFHVRAFESVTITHRDPRVLAAALREAADKVDEASLPLVTRGDEAA